MSGADLAEFAEWVTIFVGVISVAALAIQARRYVDIRRAAERQQRFENMRSLIKTYSNWSDEGSTKDMPLAPQILAVFELRSYPEYQHLFELLLQHHKFSGPNAGLINKLLEESLAAIKKKRKWWRAA